jgi:hypothetical protein
MQKRTTIILEGIDLAAVHLINEWAGSSDASSAIRFALRHMRREIMADKKYNLLGYQPGEKSDVEKTP